jgi:Ras-related protein Rab-2A
MTGNHPAKERLNSYSQYIERQDMSYDYAFKCIIVGNSGVGKSSLLLRFTDKKFSHAHEMTIGVDFGAKTIDIDNKTVKLQIWDTAGQESFRSITRSFYRDSGLVLLVYDVSDRTSFEALRKWLEDIKDMANSPQIILVGNKSDLKRAITTDEGKRFADLNSMLFIETCAREDSGVDDAFIIVTKRLLESIKKGEVDVTDTSSGIKTGLLVRTSVLTPSIGYSGYTGSAYASTNGESVSDKDKTGSCC